MGLNVLSSNFLMTLRWMVQLLRHKEVMLSIGTWTSLRNEPTWKEWGSTCWSARCYSSVGAIADMSTDWMNNWEQLCGEKLVFLVNGKLQMSQECALAIWKAISDLESTEKGVASQKRELLVPFYSDLLRLHLGSWVQETHDVEHLDCILSRLQRWSEDWSTPPMNTGWESWTCSFWRREGFRDLLEAFQYLTGGKLAFYLVL